MPDEYAIHRAATSSADLDVWRSRLARVRARVNEAARTAQRSPDEITILPTVKYFTPIEVAQLICAGATDLAENRLDALVSKQAAAGDARPETDLEPSWHFVGRVQSRQVVEIAARVAMVHSLTSERAFHRLATAADAGMQLPKMLVQVNAADDPAKDGLALNAVEPFLAALPETIRIAGFMTMPAFASDPEQSRRAFHDLRELRDRLATRFDGRHDLRALSMGTSQDLAVAVAEGATHVRLGRILLADEE